MSILATIFCHLPRGVDSIRVPTVRAIDWRFLMFIALVLFAVAALGGLTLAYLRMTDKPLPLPLALGHGGLAAAGLVTLALAVFSGGASGTARIALGIFVVAALGGFYLFSLHLRKLQQPMGVVAIHGLVAVVAFVTLLAAYLK
jgi:hypothetical protein